ncbi:MAG: hypothetical protein HZC40_19880 [Chloroflexi bacterium]|nr:hypothetical protein [Chloroflexota bacterium]
MNLTINIADIPVNLALGECDPATQAFTENFYAAFTEPYQPTPITIHIRVEPGEQFVPYGFTRNYYIGTRNHNGRIDFESHFETGWVDLTIGRGELLMRPTGRIENFLRVLYAWLCLDQGGLVLHACGVISNRRGYVFYGPSGSGKTTVASLSPERTVLSDDIVIVKKHNGKFRAFGVPFRGDFPEAPRTNDSADLAGIFILNKAAANRLEPLSIALAAARLTACVPFVMSEPQNAQRVMRVANELATSVPRYALSFKRDPEFWSMLDGLD